MRRHGRNRHARQTIRHRRCAGIITAIPNQSLDQREVAPPVPVAGDIARKIALQQILLPILLCVSQLFSTFLHLGVDISARWAYIRIIRRTEQGDTDTDEPELASLSQGQPPWARRQGTEDETNQKVFDVKHPSNGENTMYDLSQPNTEPGTCGKCKGTGEYHWGPVVNGKPSKSGTCYSCGGTGHQDRKQINRNRAYNRHKVREFAFA